jgi:ribonuclease-3
MVDSSYGINDKIDQLEKIIGYKFECKKLLFRALMRKDVLNSPADTTALSFFRTIEKITEIGHQEALETLGDSILYVRVLEKYIKDDKVMSKDFASFIKEKFGENIRLHHCASKHDLEEYFFWGKTEKNREIWNDGTVLADCLEALVGAVYLDGGMENVRVVLSALNILSK